MMKTKRTLRLILASVLAVSFLAGCGDTSGNDGSTTAGTTTAGTTTNGDGGEDTTTEPADDTPARDLGGKTFIIGNWWSNSDDFVPTTSYDEARLEYRNEIQAKYNCTIKEVNLCNWDGMQELCASSIMAGTPDANVFVLDSGFTAPLFRRKLLYDVSSLPSADLTKDKWNKLVHEVMTFNGKTYGFATDYEPRIGLFWNKRLFEEAGIDPELPYEKQAANDWTWDDFIDLCKKTTRDTDSDGIIDTYALATFTNDLFAGVLYSNNAAFARKDADGKFVNTTTEAVFFECCEYIRKLNDDGYCMPQPDGTEWDWFKAAFFDGKAAMRVAEEYNAGDMKTMQDNFGFVLFPAGPNGSLQPVYRENVLVIPGNGCYTEAEADDIFFAYDMWSEKIPGYEDDESWKISSYTRYRDERAVDETLTKMRTGANGVLNIAAYVPGLAVGDIAWHIWDEEKTPAELIESIQNSWNAVFEDANALFE